MNFFIPGKPGTLVLYVCFTFGPVFFVGFVAVEDVGGTDFSVFGNFGGFGGVGVVVYLRFAGGVSISAVVSAVGGLGPGFMAGVANGRPPRARRVASKSSLSVSLTPGSAGRGGGSGEGRVAADSDVALGVAVVGGYGAAPFSIAKRFGGANCGSGNAGCRACAWAIGAVNCEL